MSLFRKVFCYIGIKSSLRKRAAELKIVLRDSLIHISDDFIFKQHEILDKIDKKINQAKSIIKAIKEWKSWKQQNHISGNPPENELAYWDKEYIK